MPYLSKNEELWRAVEGLPTLPLAWYATSSWMLIAELFRRHPGKLAVYECPYPAGGTVWYVNEVQPDKPWPSSHGEPLVLINQAGHITPWHRHQDPSRCPIGQSRGADDDSRLGTLYPLFAPNLRKLVEAFEDCLGLGSPSRSPATIHSTIGARVIGAALTLHLHSSTPLAVTGALYDGAFPRWRELESFPALATLVPVVSARDSLHVGGPGAEVFQEFSQVFLLHDLPRGSERGLSDQPVLAIDVSRGTAFLASSTVNLMNLYREHGRNIDQTAFALVARARTDRSGRE